MIRDNSKNSLRIANIKVYTPNSLTLMTPTSGNNTNASARILN
jgi:hypothetical protein